MPLPRSRDPKSLLYGSAQPGEPVLLTPAQKAALGPGADAEPRTVKMDVVRDGSYGGSYHHAGDSVDVPEDQAETLTLAGFAVRADRVEQAQQDREFHDQVRQAGRKAGKSTAVKPIGTRDANEQPQGDQPNQGGSDQR
jgi:hypothetical protein